jgi:hypothetical protein
MAKRFGLKLSAALALAALSSLHAQAQTAGSAFLDITPSVRSFSMGMSNVVSAAGAESIGSNPANLGILTHRYDAFTSYATIMDGGEFEHIAVAMAPNNLGPIDGLGASVTRLQVSGFQGSDASGNKNGKGFGSSDTAFSLAASAALGSDLRAGLTAKALQESISSYKTNVALAADMGMSYTFTAREIPMTVAASLVNFGMKTKYLSESDPLPTTFKAGAAMPLGSFTGVLQVNRLIYDHQTQVGAGLEIGLGGVAFRVGYLAEADSGLADQSALHRFFSGMEAGVGVKFGDAKFDYAISQQAVDFQPTHRVAFSMQWGSKEARAVPKSHVSDVWKSVPSKSDWVMRSMGGY